MSNEEIDSEAVSTLASRAPPLVVVVDSGSSLQTIGPSWTTNQEISPALSQKQTPAVETIEKWPKETLKEIESVSEAASEGREKVINVQSGRRSQTFVTLAMTPIESTKEEIRTAVVEQPIPQLDLSQDLKENKDNKDGDSISSEITELRTPEVAKKASEWDHDENKKNVAYCDMPEENLKDEAPSQSRAGDEVTDGGQDKGTDSKDDITNLNKVEEIPSQSVTSSSVFNINADQGDSIQTSSRLTKLNDNIWNDPAYLDKVHLQDLRSESSMVILERKTSIGPCYTRRVGLCYAEPLGISICTPKKPKKTADSNSNDPSKPINAGICFVTTKGYFDSKKCPRAKSSLEIGRPNNKCQLKMKSEMELKVDPEDKYDGLRGKFNNLCQKIKHSLHI